MIQHPRRLAHNLVWNVGTLAWIEMTQPGGSGGAGDASAANQTTEIARLTSILANVDVALSTRTKPADQQHVIIDSSASHAVTGPLTDTQLRASAVPVSGTVTASGPLTDVQLRASAVPISAASLPLPSGAATETGHLAAIDTSTAKIPSQGQALAAASMPVVLTAAQITTLTPPAAITGFNLEATQLLVKAKTDNLDVALSTRLKPADTLAAVTAITNPVTVAQATPANLQATVTQLALSKGVQGSTGVTTQDLKDAGRTSLIFYATAAAAGTTGSETAITLTKAAGTGSTANAVSFVVTSGKRFRIQQILVSAVGHATGTTQATTFSFRINTAGGVTTTSTPVVWKGRVQTPATSLAYQQISIPVPDGYEILGDGTLQFGMTANAVFTTNAPTWDVTIIGYEY